MRTLIRFLFGCRHSRLTFPMTLAFHRGAYRVCLDCGREIDYDWEEMRNR